MIYLLIILTLAILYFLARSLTQKIYELLLRLTRRREVALTIVIILLFPGTVIHELAHLFTAGILGVPAGRLNLAPDDLRGNNISVGSVAIAETDPVRRAFIGLAPVFGGIIALTAISYLLTQPYTNGTLIKILLVYLLFAVSNSMFSSREDMHGFWPLLVILGAIFGAAYYAGFRFYLTGASLELATNVGMSLLWSLGEVLAINLVLLGIVLGGIALQKKYG